MTDLDSNDLAALKTQRPALVLELMTEGDGAGFRRAVEAGFDVNSASDVRTTSGIMRGQLLPA